MFKRHGRNALRRGAAAVLLAFAGAGAAGTAGAQ